MTLKVITDIKCYLVRVVKECDLRSHARMSAQVRTLQIALKDLFNILILIQIFLVRVVCGTRPGRQNYVSPE